MKKAVFYVLAASAAMSMIACAGTGNGSRMYEADNTTGPVVTVSPTGVPEPTKRPCVMPEPTSDKVNNYTPNPNCNDSAAECTHSPDIAWT